MRAAARNRPKAVLTPIVVLAGMMGNLAADAAYVVLIPLANGIVFHAAGRHQLRGSRRRSLGFPAASRRIYYPASSMLYCSALPRPAWKRYLGIFP